MDRVFDDILRGVIKKWPDFNNVIDLTQLDEYPSRLQLDVFPCYRRTLDHITKNCFPLFKVNRKKKCFLRSIFFLYKI